MEIICAFTVITIIISLFCEVVVSVWLVTQEVILFTEATYHKTPLEA